MKKFFDIAASKVSKEKRVPYWDEIVCNSVEIKKHSMDEQSSLSSIGSEK